MTMQKVLIVLFSIFALTACQTTGNKPTPAEIAAQVCPTMDVTLAVLQASPAISDGAKEEITRGQPIVRALCAPGAIADVSSLADLSDRMVPVLIQAIGESTLKDKEKQTLLLSVALIQIALNSVVHNVN